MPPHLNIFSVWIKLVGREVMRQNLWRTAQITITALGAATFLVIAQAEDMSTSLISKGGDMWATGNLDVAQKDFEQAVSLDPRSVAAHMKLAGLQLTRNDFSGSINTYQRVIGLDPKNALAWIGLGISYLHTGKNELSLAAFDEAVRIDPKRKEQLDSVMSKLKG
jgi:tetratricopeptide (TPR) repeat protein